MAVLINTLGAWLSLVERFVRDEEVVGSNPVAPIFLCTKASGFPAKISHRSEEHTSELQSLPPI